MGTMIPANRTGPDELTIRSRQKCKSRSGLLAFWRQPQCLLGPDARDNPTETKRGCEMTDADGPEFGRRGVLTAGAVTIATMLSHSKIAQAQTAAGAGQQQIAKTIAVDRQDDGVLLIGIDRVASGNVTDPPTFIALGHALYQLENDPGLKVGVLYGRGPNFCPGIDVPAWSQVPPGELFFPDATEFINPFSTV